MPAALLNANKIGFFTSYTSLCLQFSFTLLLTSLSDEFFREERDLDLISRIGKGKIFKFSRQIDVAFSFEGTQFKINTKNLADIWALPLSDFEPVKHGTNTSRVMSIKYYT